MRHSKRLVLISALIALGATWLPAQGIYDRDLQTDVRVVSWNVQRGFVQESTADPAYKRILTSLRPDIIVFQELSTSASTSAVLSRLNSWLPPKDGSWTLHRGTSTAGVQNAIASIYPLSQLRVDTIPSSATRGVTLALADLPATYQPQDLYLLGVHLKCCDQSPSDDQSRQRSTDAMAKWMGDVRLPGGSINLPLATPMLAVGDFNFVGGPQPELTLRTGDIQDEATFGPDVKGDWDDTDITDAMPRDPNTNNSQTWPTYSTTPTSRLDRFYYTDSVVKLGRSFVVNTRTLTPSQRNYYALLEEDTVTTSDHLPIVLDLRYRLTTGVLLLSRDAYRCSDRIDVRLVDNDLDEENSVLVLVSSSSGQVREMVLSAEESPGVFSGSLFIGPEGTPDVFPVSELEDLTFVYEDESNASGNPESIVASAEVDCSPPAIAGLRIEERGPRHITIAFSTSEPAFVTGLIGTTCGTGFPEKESALLKTEHLLRFDDLNPSTEYSFQINATDEAGNLSVNPDVGFCYTASTENSVRVVINEVNWNDPSQVELYNAGDDPAAVGGWRLRSWNFNLSPLPNYTIPAGTIIPPGGFITITERTGTQTPTQFFTGFFMDWFPGFAGAVAIDNGTDSVEDFVRWNTLDLEAPSGTTFAGSATGIGSWTLSRLPDGEDSNTGADWQSGDLTFGSPNRMLPKTTGIYERFDGATTFDLSNHLLTFTPDPRTPSGYTFSVAPIAALPETHGGTLVNFDGQSDLWVFYRMSGALRPQLFGTPYREFFISSNGFIGLDQGDLRSTMTPAEFFELRRISALMTDLDPTRGEVRVQELSNRLVVSWQNVPREGLNDSNSFQFILHSDGRIQIAYGALSANVGITGISRGGRVDNPLPPPVDLNGGKDPFLKLPGIVVF